ncbi:DUF2958 domain-containing protein [Sphingomonas cavernae]|uniref:DUF2958 domain-containing protein n=1 Tax=Sphingomonas cavernae TaxID=2320861 RepID=A0A418WSG7_9SPHN|nr:DUF2958 domain-containing protein [Sphingomonas cavernae]RJF94198.1 DUF2958 domain-containing protein [Sphingomonas cavernae]
MVRANERRDGGKLLSPDLRAALRANDEARRAAVMEGAVEPDFVPVAKFFSPVGAATWLATELGEDGDTLFGLADLGFGCPELGAFSLAELLSVRLRFGLGIERDLDFDSGVPLSGWAAAARRAGSIITAEQNFCRAAVRGDELPKPLGNRGDG